MASGPLMPAAHGLGLLLVAAMTLSGLSWWLGVEAAKDIHETLAPLVWAYLVGHVAAAVWHQWRGEPLITRMFRLRRYFESGMALRGSIRSLACYLFGNGQAILF